MTDSKVSIALVDDDDTDNYIHKRIIESSGLARSTHVFDKPQDALEWLAEAPRNIDLLFLDINMPVINGFEFLKKHRELPESHTAGHILVMLTSSQNEEDREKAIGLGAGFLSKPLTKEMFSEVVERYSNCGPRS